jgi:hypothetical protein
MSPLKHSILALLALTAVLAAEQATPYVITDFPITAIKPDSIISVKWAGMNRALNEILPPDSGTIYYSRSPGGSIIANYANHVDAALITGIITDNRVINGEPPQREIMFRPLEQKDMGAGVFYCIVAFPYSIQQGPFTVRDTFYSNELPLIVETTRPTDLKSPYGTITDLTPTFSWDVNPGVPYYHVILSDEKIEINDSSGSFSIAGLSIIWQAITPNTQIVYGAPDPSGTITASPPPLSPGKTYSAIVLNNYGNHPAYTSTRVGSPKIFTIAGDTLKAPVNISPNHDTLDNDADSVITFKWTHLDTNANTYRVYIYVASNIENIGAQLVVWENEVTAGNFRGRDTGFISVNARSVLTQNHYTWKVIAIDAKGAGRAGDTTSFDYQSPTGTIVLQTLEHITIGSATLNSNVAAVEIQVEVLDGSLEKPLLFYTDNTGYLERQRPKGTYRITAHKSGFEDLTTTIRVGKDSTTSQTLVLKRPDATIFGKVMDDPAGTGINLATVIAVSENGDTVRAETDRFGSFILSCSKADWTVWALKTGYITALSRDTTVAFGQSINFGTIKLTKVPFTLSGVVKNTLGQPIIGARVKLERDGSLADQVPSTSQTGVFAFSAEAGTYTLSAEKTGFEGTPHTILLSSSMQMNLTLAPGAASVEGYVYGGTWVGTQRTVAPLTGAKIHFVKLHAALADTLTADADPTYGHFSRSLAGNDTFLVWSSALGFTADVRIDTLRTRSGVTQPYNDTLDALGIIRGSAQLVNQSNVLMGAIDAATIVVSDKQAGRVIGTVKTQADGSFELRGIPDGDIIVSAGKDGYVLSAILPDDTLEVIGGRVKDNSQFIDAMAIEMKAGTKQIKWSVTIGAQRSSSASIKLQSPFQKTMSPDSTIRSAGAGDYVVVVDADDPSVLDLSYHRFNINDTITLPYTEPLVLPVSHTARDTATLRNDSVTVALGSHVMLDSAVLYYRDNNAGAWQAMADTSDDSVYSFTLLPPKDGSYLQYYFRAFKGSDIYGYSQETFRTWIPASTRLTKLEIVPSRGDTLTFPADYAVAFRFQAFYGSSFIPDTSFPASDLTWTLDNEQGCELQSNGLSARVTTGGATSLANGPVKLTATVLPQSLVKNGTCNAVSAYFRVSAGKITSIAIRRVDAKSPDPITTAPGDKAEFVAEGLDAAGTKMAITPSWSCRPAAAGTMSADGAYMPASTYAGWVRIFATISNGSDSAQGEFNVNAENLLQSGLPVAHLITQKDRPDTMKNFNGCTIIFPDSVVGPGETGKLTLVMPRLENMVALGLVDYKVVGNVYDIQEENNVAFLDSITLTLDVPEDQRQRAQKEKAAFSIACWNADSLLWEKRPNSVVASDGKTIRVCISHFSRYAVVADLQTAGTVVAVSPNPFSPYVRGAPASWPAPPSNSSGGTWIKFAPATRADVEANVRIVNVLGDRVYSVIVPKAEPARAYYVWWDGKTNDRDIDAARYVVGQTTTEKTFYAPGDRLCRNGRYIAIVSLKDQNGNVKHYMKQAILIK